MMIEDVELRNIYKTASEEHLQNLEAGLIHLEKYPDDTARLEDVLREAHTLKGDSRMLGVNGVETLTHQLEEILVAIKQGKSILTSEVCDRCYQGLDAMRKLVHEAITGEPADVNIFYVLAQLMGAEASTSLEPEPELSSHTDAQHSPFPDTIAPAPLFNSVNALFPDSSKPPSTLGNDLDALFPDTIAAIPSSLSTHTEVKSVAVPAPPSSSPSEPISTSNYQIETIRVEPQKLDVLMTQAGELTVTKNRIAHHLVKIEEILTLWEDWSRDAFINRGTLNHQELDWHNGTLKQVQHFHCRATERLERLGILVNQLKNQAYEDSARLDVVANELESGIRTLRLLPWSTIFNLFPRMVRDLAKQQAKAVNLIIEGGETKADKLILAEMKDPLLHLLRNAIDHGIETPQKRQELGKPHTATIRLRGYQSASSVGIEIIDDGRGLDIENIKQTALRRGVCSEAELAAMTTTQIQSLIFAPGFSTRTLITEISGRGVGLDVVRSHVERLKGTIQVESTPGAGCKFRLQFDTSLTTSHVLIVEVNHVSYALPVEFVQTTLLVSRQEIFALEGSQTTILEGQPVSVAWLADLLELPLLATEFVKPTNVTQSLSCMILQVGTERFGLFVDALLDEQDVVLKSQSQLLQRVRNVSGATILSTGQVCMILNPQDLLKSMQKQTRGVIAAKKALESTIKPVILLVEDSITIRTQVKRILEGAGYKVVAAVDGLDGWNKLRTQHFDAVVSDVQMPNLDGLALTAKIRQYQEYAELPIILVTTLASDEDKTKGAEAGANAYLIKGAFDQKVLLDTLKRLV